MQEKQCIVCKNIVNSDEYNSLAPEFKSYPVHFDCFDTFTNADEFLEFAKNKVIGEEIKESDIDRQHEQPIEVSPS